MSFVTIDGTRLAYRVDGAANAPAIVLVHCLGADLQMWQEQVKALKSRFFVVRYDCRGHGRSDLSGEPVTIARLGSDVLALIDHLRIARASICGLSLGGLTAQWFVVHHPERVERAIFANTAARLGSVESWEARIQAVKTGGMAAVREAVIARFFSDDFRARHPEIAKKFGDNLQAIRPEGYIAACSALRDADLRAEVSSIRAPVLVIAGGLDEATPQAQSEALHTAIGGSKIVLLKAAAHLSNVEQTEAFNKSLIEFLGEER